MSTTRSAHPSHRRLAATFTTMLAIGASAVLAAPAVAADATPCEPPVTKPWAGTPVQRCALAAAEADGRIPVYRSPVARGKGAKLPAPAGWLHGTVDQYFACQERHSSAGFYHSGGWRNDWWAFTKADSGTQWGYVPEVYFKGGDNDEPDGGLAACGSSKPPVPPGPGSGQGATYVALGDSYSAGTGSRDYSWDGACWRGPRAYPALVAKALGYAEAQGTFGFPACNGAKTGVGKGLFTGAISSTDVLKGQLARLGDATRLVTISIGGNDAGFSDIAKVCGLPEAPWVNRCVGSRGSMVARARRFIKDTIPGRLNKVYEVIKAKAPKARVIVVGYPRLFGAEDCNAWTGFSAEEREELNKAANLMADITRQAAGRYRFLFVDPRDAFNGHDNCAGKKAWINGLSRRKGTWATTDESFHPNAEGHKAYARLVLAKVG